MLVNGFLIGRERKKDRHAKSDRRYELRQFLKVENTPQKVRIAGRQYFQNREKITERAMSGFGGIRILPQRKPDTIVIDPAPVKDKVLVTKPMDQPILTQGRVSERAIEIAQTYLGNTETGSNDGPWLRKLMDLAGNPNHWVPGESYCIAALCDIFDIACKEENVGFPFEYSLSTQTFYQNALEAHYAGSVYERGDIAIFRDGMSWRGHAALVTGTTTEGLTTIEFNTSPAEKGSQRNGGGCYAKFRGFKQFAGQSKGLYLRGAVKTSRL